VDEKIKLATELSNEFMTLSNSYNIEKTESLKERFEHYLENYEDTIDKRMFNTLCLLKALIEYAKTDYIPSSYELMLPMLNNLSFGEKVEYLESNYNKTLLTTSIFMGKSYQQSLDIINAIEASFEEYPLIKKHEYEFKRAMYINFVDRLLYAKGFDELSEEEHEEVTNLFYEYLGYAKFYCEKLGKLNWFAILLVREGLFNDDKHLICNAMVLQRSLKEEKLHDVMDSNLTQYAAVKMFAQSEPSRADVHRLRLLNILARKGMTLFELARKVDLSINLLRDIVSGIKDLEHKTMERIMVALDLHLEDFFG